MDFVLSKIGSIGPFFLLLGVLIFIHEWGHFIVARICGVRVETFSIGFGPRLFSKQWGETRYQLSIIPLGGFVKMYGDGTEDQVPVEAQKESFIHQTVLKKIAIVSAGPLMNLFFAFFLFLLLGVMGPPEVNTTIGDVKIDSAAYRAGLRYGDTITSVNGKNVQYFEDLTKELGLLQDGSSAHLEVTKADGTTIPLLVPVKIEENKNPISDLKRIGVIDGLMLSRASSKVGLNYKSKLLKDKELKSIVQITAVNSTAVSTAHELKLAISSAPANQNLELSIEVNKDKVVTKTVLPNGEAWTFSSAGFVKPELMIRQVRRGSPAEKAGLKPGDQILKLNGKKLTTWSDLVETIKATSKGQKTDFLVANRNGEHTLSIIAEQTELITSTGQVEYRPTIGIAPGLEYLPPITISREFGSVFELTSYAKQESFRWVKVTLSGFKKLLTGEVSHKTLSGVISIGKVAKESLDIGWSYFIKMMAIISINLFLLNLLPVPVLDGGHLIFYFIELATGSPVGIKTKLIGQQIGIVMILSLVAYTVFNDVSRILFSGW